MTQNIETLKTELKLQQEANLSKNEYILKRNFVEGKLVGDKPMYRSTAEFVKTKVVTLPSCESLRPIYAVETEGIVEEKVFYNNDSTNQKNSSNKKELKEDTTREDTKAETTSETKKDDSNEKAERTKAENEAKSRQELENTLKIAINKLNENLEQVTSEKSRIESQLASTLSELKASQNENTILITKHEQQVKFLNDQLQIFQVVLNYIYNKNKQLFK